MQLPARHPKDTKEVTVEYGDVLKRVSELSAQIVDARNHQRHREAIAIADEIGALYFPDDRVMAGRIAYLVNAIGVNNYIAGASRGLKDYVKEQRATFEPPF
jgi:hypothetical protein